MSASPNNTSVDLLAAEVVPGSEGANPRPSFQGYDALQALLAFSSLHEQIRQKRALATHDETGKLARSDAWQLEHFVLDEVLQLVADRALAITGADGIAIALAEDDAIVCRASSGTIAPDAGARLDPNSGFSGACLRRGKIIRCDDSEHDLRVNVEHCRRLGARSMVAVPLSARQSVVGLVEAFSTEAYGFNDSDVRSLNLLAELILSALRPEEENRLAEISQRVVAKSDSATPSPDAEMAMEIAPQAAPPGQLGGPPILGSISLVRADLPAEPIEVGANVPTPEPDVHERPAGLSSSHPSSEKELILAAPGHIALEKSHPGIRVVFTLVLLAALVGGGVWWALQYAGRGEAAHSNPAHLPKSSPLQNDVAPLSDDSNEAADASNDVRKPGAPAEVTAIRHWSSAESSTVAIDLQDQVQYEAHHLADPERIYFDLHDTSLSAALSGKTITVDDAFLVRVRVAQPESGLTRVVLETKGNPAFSVSLEQNPYRLLVEIRRQGTPQPIAARMNLFSPVVSAAFSTVNRNPASARIDQSSSPRLAAPQAAVPGAKLRSPLPRLRIVLDAGHGGWDLGTVGKKGLLEKDLVLDIVNRLGQLIEGKLDAEVIYTRQDDTYLPLEKRAEIANLSHGDLFLSIHANYSGSASARGVETYYTNTYSSVRARTADASGAGIALQSVDWTNVDIREKVRESHRFAACIQRALYGTLETKNPGLRDRGVKEASYVVLTGTSMPAVLAEVSFVSSPTDESELQNAAYRQQIAEALYKGLAHYRAESSPRVKIASAIDKPAGKQ
jgi:N-acetylmuramoyl-L-alanine amidase